MVTSQQGATALSGVKSPVADGRNNLNLAIMRKESKQQHHLLAFLPGPPSLTFQASMKSVFYCQLINDGSSLLAEIAFSPACAYMLPCSYDISQARKM